jgi:hypothetical protein
MVHFLFIGGKHYVPLFVEYPDKFNSFLIPLGFNHPVQSFTIVYKHIIPGTGGNSIAICAGCTKNLGNELPILIGQDDIEKNSENYYRYCNYGKYQFGIDCPKHIHMNPGVPNHQMNKAQKYFIISGWIFQLKNIGVNY